MEMIAALKVLNGPMQGTEFLLMNRGIYNVGRSNNCQMYLADADDNTISRLHCSIRFDRNQVFIRDLWSKNGTFISKLMEETGRMLSQGAVSFRLRDGDIISIGSVKLQITISEAIDMSSSAIVLDSSAYLPRLSRDELRSEYETVKLNWWGDQNSA